MIFLMQAEKNNHVEHTRIMLDVGFNSKLNTQNYIYLHALYSGKKSSIHSFKKKQ